MRIALFSSHRATRFKKVLELNEDFRRDVKLFYSDDPKTLYLKEYMDEIGIEYCLDEWRKHKLSFAEKHLLFSEGLLKKLKEHEVDYVFCNGYTLLEGEILKEYENKMITFHAGLLPWYAGPKPIDRMKKNNEFLMGTAAIFINSGVDSGPIIMESIVPGKTVEEEGYDIVTNAQIEMIQKVYRLLKENRIHVEESQVTIEGADYKRYEIFPYIP